MVTNVPRRFVDSSMSAPMYWLGRHDAELDPGLLDRLDVATGSGSRAGLSTTTMPRPCMQLDVVLDRRRRGDEVEVELALEPLLDDLHVEQAEEAAAEAEAERHRALRLEGEAGVVEVELLERLAQERVVLAAERVDAGEDEALGRLVAGQRLGRRARPAVVSVSPTWASRTFLRPVAT